MKPNKKSLYLFFPLLFLLCYACEKEMITPEDSEVVTGESKGMIYHSIKQPLEFATPYGGYAQLSLDIDDNDTADIHFYNYLSISYGSRSSEIFVTHPDIEIGGYLSSDSIYRCFSQNSSSESYTWFNLASGFSCPGTVVEAILSETDFALNLEKGIPVKEQFDHPAQIMMLASQNFSGSETTDPQTGFITYSGNHLIYGGWNGLGSQYLAFRMRSGESFRYGWIRLSVTDYGRIYLYDWAIQHPDFNAGI